MFLFCTCFFFFFLMFVTLKFEISGAIRISDVNFAFSGYVFCVLVTWNVRFGISVIVNVKNQEARCIARKILCVHQICQHISFVIIFCRNFRPRCYIYH